MKKRFTSIEEKRELFLKLYDSQSDGLYRHCYFRLSNKTEAEQMVQEAYTRLWDYFLRKRFLEYPKALLYRIANNLIIDWYRKRKESSLDALQEGGMQFRSEQDKELTLGIEIKELKATILCLDQKYQQILLLRYVNDCSVKEIAQTLSLNENTVSVRIHRAIKELRKHYA
ncbi:MAG: RNA polymerase sigma factor [Candidatus Harrisonbacteria bacterium]|nr:RNA polymerase sigma factor [Candidatus Harrisonbacteria bacterium]